MKDLNKITKRRLNRNTDIILLYTCTATCIAGNWTYVEHSPKPIPGNRLGLNKKWQEDNRSINYDFAIYNQENDGTYKLSDTDSLAIVFSKNANEYYATYCVEIN